MVLCSSVSSTQALFVRVVPYQCLGCVWSQRDKKDNMSPTIRATIAQFNTVTNRVIGSLLCVSGAPPGPGPGPRGAPSAALLRARVVEKWIKVAQVRSVETLTTWSIGLRVQMACYRTGQPGFESRVRPRNT